ncbi:hypothetical protein EON80_13565 [bacterium]|nr:MAG: hypothetical protein EON80_13565 [bacterium]
MILQRLRDATRPDHERLEDHIDLLGRPWSMPFYRSLLSKFYGLYASIEPPTFSHAEWEKMGIDTASRLKLPSLVRDLHFLGLSDADIAALPLFNEAPKADTFASALGCAYVMEGSTLGGQIISRHLKQELGLELGPDNGLSFFASYGSEVGPKWREFTGVLDFYQGSEAEQTELIESAVKAFQAFDRWLADIL